MLAEFSILPLGKEHLAEDIAQVLKIVDESSLNYRLHAMGTEVEGSWDEVMGLIRRCHEHMAKTNNRVYTQIKIDDLKGQKDLITAKVATVECKVGKKLKT